MTLKQLVLPLGISARQGCCTLLWLVGTFSDEGTSSSHHPSIDVCERKTNQETSCRSAEWPFGSPLEPSTDRFEDNTRHFEAKSELLVMVAGQVMNSQQEFERLRALQTSLAVERDWVAVAHLQAQTDHIGDKNFGHDGALQSSEMYD